MTASNTPKVYLDACVLLAFVSGEEDRSDQITSLLEDADTGVLQILTSTLSITEVAYIKSSQRVREERDDSEIEELWSPQSPIKLLEFSREVAFQARRIVRKVLALDIKRVRSVDAVHLATADFSECEHFFTYEREMTRTAWNSLVGAEVAEPFQFVPRFQLGQ